MLSANAMFLLRWFRLQCKGTLKRPPFFTFFKSVFLIILLAGCYSRQQLTFSAPTNGQVKKEMAVLTKQDKIVRLTSYEITTEKIIGTDENGKYYEEYLENVKMLTLTRILNKKRTIISSVVILSFAFFLYYYFSIQGFSQLR